MDKTVKVASLVPGDKIMFRGQSYTVIDLPTIAGPGLIAIGLMSRVSTVVTTFGLKTESTVTLSDKD